LSGVETRFVRLLLKKPGTSYGNYSIYEIDVAAPDGTLLKIASASASSVQWDAVANKARTTDLIFDGITECDSRWSSAMPATPPPPDAAGGESLQWLYLDLGSKQQIAKLTIYWEAAYAAEYDVQRAE
jgi:hypothetical protein